MRDNYQSLPQTSKELLKFKNVIDTLECSSRTNEVEDTAEETTWNAAQRDMEMSKVDGREKRQFPNLNLLRALEGELRK